MRWWLHQVGVFRVEERSPHEALKTVIPFERFRRIGHKSGKEVFRIVDSKYYDYAEVTKHRDYFVVVLLTKANN